MSFSVLLFEKRLILWDLSYIYFNTFPLINFVKAVKFSLLFFNLLLSEMVLIIVQSSLLSLLKLIL